jgi:hypothetical protein
MENGHPRKTIRLDYVIIINIEILLMYQSPRTSQWPLTATSAAIVLLGRFAWGGNFKFSYQKTNLFPTRGGGLWNEEHF